MTEAPAEIVSVDLNGKDLDFGPVHFVRAEWSGQRAPRLVVLRYCVEGNGTEEPLGLRLDLDKRAVLDDLDETIRNAADVNEKIKEHAADLSSAVVNEWRSRRTTSTRLE